VVFTGLSGSGKSSLAFDTIYAEGQRRYVESLSAYARQFLEMMQKPDVDQIDGLSPAISIEQKTTSKNPRSTVGTVTEIYDYMRLLWARVGVPYSPATGLPIESQTVSQMVDRTLALPEGSRLYLLAPAVRGRKGEYARSSPTGRRRASSASRSTAPIYEIADAPALDKKLKHDIDVVVDRVVVRPDMATRLADSFETALKLADGIAVVEFADQKDQSGEPMRSDLLGEVRLPGIRLHHSPRSSRACSRSTIRSAPARSATASASSRRSTRNSSCPTRTVAEEGALAPWAKSSSPYLHPDAGGAGEALRLLADRALAQAARRRCGRHPVMAPARRPSPFRYDDGLQVLRDDQDRSRAWSATSSAA
jgi:excinuclease ABC subunit A